MTKQSKLVVLNRPEDIDKVSINEGDAVYFRDWFSAAILDTIKPKHPCLAICDVESRCQEFDIPCVFFPAVGFGMVTWNQVFVNTEFSLSQTEKCFYFSVNKKNLERFLLLKLIEWFGLSHYHHTYSGQAGNFDMSNFLFEYDDFLNSNQELKSFLLRPVTDITHSWITGSDNMAWLWNQGLSNKMQSSAVALLCESPTFSEPNYVFTEKTYLAFLSGNFPIWVGSAGQATAAKNMGFDIFEDIIDHSYQDYDSVWHRCYHAIHDNLDILCELDTVSKLRYRHHDRLYHNYCHVKIGIEQFINQQAQKIPNWILDQLYDKFQPQ